MIDTRIHTNRLKFVDKYGKMYSNIAAQVLLDVKQVDVSYVYIACKL